MIALLAALSVGALAILQPWATDTVAPQLGISPNLGIDLDESVAVSPAGGLAVAPASPVSGKSSKLVAAGLAAGNGGREESRQVSIGPARAVASARPVSSPGGAPEPAAPEATPPESPTAPAVVPVAAPSPSPAAAAVPPASVLPERGEGPSGPIGAGAGPGEVEHGSAIEVGEGEEGALAFSFLVQAQAYRSPGEENLILRFAGEAGGSPSFGLQLWDDGGGTQHGLWASGDAMGGERFLAPVADGAWHRVVTVFKASSEGDGFYLVLLDGEPVDARAFVSLIEPGSDSALIEVGLFRGGERVEGFSEVLVGPTELGETLESVLP